MVIKEEGYSQQARVKAGNQYNFEILLLEPLCSHSFLEYPWGLPTLALYPSFSYQKLAWRASKFHVNQKGNQLSNLNIYCLNPSKEMSYLV